MQAFLDYVVKGLVDQPEAVHITATDRNGITMYAVRVHEADVGKVIGRKGATIQALRCLLQVGAAKQGLRCAMDVVED